MLMLVGIQNIQLLLENLNPPSLNHNYCPMGSLVESPHKSMLCRTTNRRMLDRIHTGPGQNKAGNFERLMLPNPDKLCCNFLSLDLVGCKFVTEFDVIAKRVIVER